MRKQQEHSCSGFKFRFNDDDTYGDVTIVKWDGTEMVVRIAAVCDFVAELIRLKRVDEARKLETADLLGLEYE